MTEELTVEKIINFNSEWNSMFCCGDQAYIDNIKGDKTVYAALVSCNVPVGVGGSSFI